MAYYNIKRGVWVPDPVTVTRETTKLIDCPNLLDNVWRLIKISTAVWLKTYKAYTRSEEEMDDLEANIYIQAYLNLLEKVRTKTYRLDLSLYLNIRSCTQSAVGHCMHHMTTGKYKYHVHAVSLQAVDGSEEGWLSTLASETVPKYMTEYDRRQMQYKQVARKIAKSKLEAGGEVLERSIRYTKAAHNRMERTWRDDAYLEYLEECTIFGVAPITKDAWEIKNYGSVWVKPEPNKLQKKHKSRWKPMSQRTPEEQERMRAYWREQAKKKKRPD